MPLENILLEIEERKKKELAALEEELSRQVESIEKETADAINALRIAYQKRKEEEMKTRERRSADLTSLEVRRAVSQKRSEILEEAMKKVDSLVVDALKGSGYEEILQSMYQAVEKKLGKDLVVLVDSRDKVAQSVKTFKAKPVNNGFKLGAIFQTSDSQKEIDLTLPVISRFLRERISEKLSGSIEG